MPVTEVSADDQLLVATGDTPLEEVLSALPDGLYPPFPPPLLPGGVGGLVLRGGFGQRFFFAGEVLGALFRTPGGQVVRAGGRVVKNVQGYDLVRPLVGSFGALGEVLEVTLRLRPGRASALLVRPGDLAGVPDPARFAWQDADRVYLFHFGAPREVAAVTAAFGGEPAPAPDYRPLFTRGMGVGTGPLRDERFGWADGGAVPPAAPLFGRLARALS